MRSLAVGLLACLCPSAFALPVDTFDFESLSTGDLTSPLLLTGAHVDVQLNVGMADWSILNLAGAPAPVEWADRSLQISGPDNGADPSPLTITFVGGVTGFSIQYADLGGDVDQLTFRLYSGAEGTGTLIDTQSAIWDRDLRDGEFGEFVFSFLAPTTSLGSVVIDAAGDSGGHTMFYDNLSVIVPAPHGILALSLAATLAPARRRRRV